MKIIGEIGLNHCGSENRAMNMVEDLMQTNIDGLTFQIREQSFYDNSHPRKRKLSKSFYNEIVNIVKSNNKLIGIAICEKYDIASFNNLKIDFWKTLSWDINNKKLQSCLQRTNKLVYVSTGMSSEEEIIRANKTMKNIHFIHTQLDYDFKTANLKAISRLNDILSVPIAYGLHSPNYNLLYAALAFKPSALFFYVKDHSGGENPDNEHAIYLNNINNLIKSIKEILLAIGNGTKEISKNKLHPIDDLVCE